MYNVFWSYLPPISPSNSPQVLPHLPSPQIYLPNFVTLS